MNRNGPLRVCVLLGGDTGERIVSLHSGAAVADALLRRGHAVRLLDPATGRREDLGLSPEDGRLLPEDGRLPPDDRPGSRPGNQPAPSAAERLRSHESLEPDPSLILPSLANMEWDDVDVAAIILHGGAGEGGQVQSVLELAGIPFTGSAAGPSALAMDKVLAKRIFAAEGIPIAEQMLWQPWSTGPAGPRSGQPAALPAASLPSSADLDRLGGYPLVVKPIAGGSTVGLTLVRDPSGWAEAAAAAAGQIDPERGLLVERFIPGRELTVGILEDRTLPVVEIEPKTGFYDYRRKYTKGETNYTVPADLPDEVSRELQDWALRAYRSLGCRDMARVDFRLDPQGRGVCLEVNTIPGMTETSLLPMAAGAVGIGFDDLVEILCSRAAARGRRQAGGGRRT